MFNFFKKKKKNSKDGEDKEKQPEKDKSLENIEVRSMPKKFKHKVAGSQKTKVVGLIIVIGGAIVLIATSVFLFLYIYNSGGSRDADTEDQAMNRPNNAQKQEEVESEPEENKEEVKQEEVKVFGCGENALSIPIDSRFGDESFDYQGAGIFNCLGERISSNCKQATSTIKVEDIGEVKFDILGERQGKCTVRLSYPENITNENFNLYSGSSMQCFYNMEELNNFGYQPSELAYYVYQQSSIGNLSEESSHCLGTAVDLWEQQKLAQETKEEEDEQEISLNMGVDTDQDGLSDVAENTVFVTDSGKKDTDEDGYTDSEEVLNLYNPAGSGTLQNSGLLARHSDDEHNYSILYPKDWSKDTSAESTFFRSSLGGSVQILFERQEEKQSLIEWYGNLNNQDISINDIKETKSGLQVVYSMDGLTAYLSPSGGVNEIFILSYSPEEGETIEFLSVFKMMVESFQMAN